MIKIQWTKDQEDRLRTLIVNEKKTYTECGNDLGYSRSAIAGKCRRMKLTKPVKTYIISELKPNQCRYPVLGINAKNYLFCGVSTKINKSYCDKHHKITHLDSNRG